ncbi:McrC family protein [Pseudomonas sp. SWRI100]|uniref:5-methylcytosine restriction system specificity protein McrC n=1 Tax=Pseudomonas TaxID=286 RepID=UPI00164492BC|nr:MULTISPECIES: hypothetical protein [Pseudomonas]MBC3494433.1 hypothetical protein [Pseudomonas sp. SWRI67]MBV4528815.1 McrC family protein [Pseudomonas kermanshahensis]
MFAQARIDPGFHVVVEGGAEHVLMGVSHVLSDPVQRRIIQKIVDVTDIGDGKVRIKHSSRLIVGRVKIGPYTITTSPPFGADVFLLLVLYATHGELRKFNLENFSGVKVGVLKHDMFLSVMSSILVAQAESLLQGHISKAYVKKETFTKNLRGNIVWSKNFGRHPLEGLRCRVFEQDADNLLNRIVLAGLEVASTILEKTSKASAASTQLFIWRQISSKGHLLPTDFDLADRNISRLTESYRPLIQITKALVLGVTPLDLTETGSARLNDLDFSIPSLFESFLLRLLAPYAAKLGLRLVFKNADRHALIDETGKTYRKVEPDITVYKGIKPVGVIDAKFKPRYVESSPQNSSEPLGKVTNEDIYQLFFYQSRLQAVFSQSIPPRAIIIAPKLSPSDVAPPDIKSRTVVWCETNSGVSRPSLKVLPIQLQDVLKMLLHKGECEVVEECLSEIAAELKLMAS